MTSITSTHKGVIIETEPPDLLPKSLKNNKGQYRYRISDEGPVEITDDERAYYEQPDDPTVEERVSALENNASESNERNEFIDGIMEGFGYEQGV